MGRRAGDDAGAGDCLCLAGRTNRRLIQLAARRSEEPMRCCAPNTVQRPSCSVTSSLHQRSSRGAGSTRRAIAFAAAPHRLRPSATALPSGDPHACLRRPDSLNVPRSRARAWTVWDGRCSALFSVAAALTACVPQPPLSVPVIHTASAVRIATSLPAREHVHEQSRMVGALHQHCCRGISRPMPVNRR